jgi:hypothetical protein
MGKHNLVSSMAVYKETIVRVGSGLGDGGEHQFSKRAADLFARAWPAGPVRSDVALYETLSEAQRDAVLLRLEKMLEAETGATSQAALSRAIGVGRSYFLKLHRRWKADRRLSTLVPYQTRPARRTARNRLNELMELTVRRLLRRAPPGVRNVDVANEAALWEVRRQSRLDRMRGVAPSGDDVIEVDRSRIGVALATIGFVRRELAADAAWLKEYYGEALILDLTAIALAVTDDCDGHRQAVVALVIERASGLVMGHAMGTVEHASELPFAAIAMAEERLASDRLDVCGSEPFVTSVTAIVVDNGVGREQAEERRSGRRSPARPKGSIAVTENMELWRGSVRRFGMLARERVGFRIGRMHIHPRSTYTGDAKVDLADRIYVAADVEEAVRIWTYEVERHNHPIEERLASLDRLCARGQMAAALVRLRTALQQAAEPTIARSASASASR